MKKLVYVLLFSASVLKANGQQADTTYIYFDFDRAVLTPAARAKLSTFVENFQSAKDSSTIIIRGHCDFVGSLQYNELLSRRRSFAVHEYLLNNGIPKTSVALIESFGERIPRNENRTAEERALNRRVELIWSLLPPQPQPQPIPIPKSEPPPKKPIDTITDFSKKAIDTAKEGQVLRLRNINFEGGRHIFLRQAEPALLELLEVMRSYPTLHIEIQGHICCQYDGNDGYDYDTGEDRLSYNRARAVYDFLVFNGIDRQRMTYRGFSATRPLVYPERTEEDKTTNRRVEIKITRR